MTDAALISSGAQIALASSSDENYPPENIINGNTETFWISTGMFPQEFMVRFKSLTKISLVTMHSYNVRRLKVEKNTLNDPLEFEPVAEKELECTEDHLQTNTFSLRGISATHLRFIIMSGYDHFISVHKVTIDGTHE